MTALNAKNDERFPEFRQILKDANFRTVTTWLQDDVIRDVKGALYLLWGCVVFVLVIGCVNIANLVIVRASARSRELATRHAIGGDLVRLARQLFTETTVLALGGGALGLLLGWWTLSSVSALNLDQLPRGYEIGLDWVAVAVMIGLTLVVGLAIGVAPVLRLRRMNLNIELREESRGGTSSRRANLVRRGLAIVQVAIALTLLVGAGLLVTSFQAVLRLDLGFTPENVMTAAVSPPATTYKDPPALISFGQRALTALRSLPGVDAAALTSTVPFNGNVNNSVIFAEGYMMKPGESLLAPTVAIVSPGYFEALGIHMERGRTFEDRDTADANKVVVVDDRLAKKFWPNQDPIGRRMYTPTDSKDFAKVTPQTQFLTVVGVTKEVLLIDPRADVKPVGVVYLPYDQQPIRSLSFVVKTKTVSTSVENDIRREVNKIDPQLPVYRMRSMQEWIDRALVGRRSPMLIALAFGIVALLLGRHRGVRACSRTASRSANASWACGSHSAARPAACSGSCSPTGSASSAWAWSQVWPARSASGIDSGPTLQRVAAEPGGDRRDHVDSRGRCPRRDRYSGLAREPHRSDHCARAVETLRPTCGAGSEVLGAGVPGVPPAARSCGLFGFCLLRSRTLRDAAALRERHSDGWAEQAGALRTMPILLLRFGRFVTSAQERLEPAH